MQNWKLWFGTIIGILALGWFARDLELKSFYVNWLEIHWGLYGLSTFLFCLSFLIRAIRWRTLIRGICQAPLNPVCHAYFIGMLANRLLPARLGEVARCIALARWLSVSKTSLLTTVAVEKMFDSVALLVVGFLALLSLGNQSLPEGISQIRQDLITSYPIALSIFVLIIGLTAISIPFLLRILEPTENLFLQKHGRKLLNSMHVGFHSLRKGKLACRITVETILSWILLVISEYLAFLSFGWRLPFSASLVLCTAISLAATLPQAPSFIGVYQLAVQYTIESVYQVPTQEAKTFAVAIWAMQIFPLGLVGLYSLWRTGTKNLLKSLPEKINDLPSEGTPEK